MILFVNSNNKIEAWNEYLSEEDVSKFPDAVWFDGEIPETEDKEGYIVVFYLEKDTQSIRVEYEPIQKIEMTINEKIYEAVSKSQDEIRQEGADMVMEEMKKRGLIV